MTKKILLFIIATVLIKSIIAQNESDVKMKLNGFGDVIYGQPFGNAANKATQDTFNKYGESNYLSGMHKGFTSHGIDILGTVSMKNNLKFQAELNVEGSRGADGGEIELEMERLYLDYGISEKFGLQFGFIFTPIGYINRNLYSRAWLMNSIRFYQAVESGAGVVPNHFIGATAYGSFVLPKGNALNYIIGYGKARDISPANENFANDNPGYQVAGNLEWHYTGESEFMLGLGGFTNEIHTFNVPLFGQLVDIGDSSASPLLLQELGFNPYIKYTGKLLDILVEYTYVNMMVLQGDYPGDTKLNTLSAELAINSKINGKRFAPYVRYDFIFFPAGGGPYYGLRKVTDDVLTKVYTPNFNAIMGGIAYDISSHNRIKIEYIHHFDGPFQANGIYLQTAFGF